MTTPSTPITDTINGWKSTIRPAARMCSCDNCYRIVSAFPERNLSAIPETSRDCRSGSSAFTSLSSNGSVAKRTPGGAHTPSMPVIAEMSTAQSDASKRGGDLESAVRRLSLGGDEYTGVGIKIDITSAVNPWDPRIQSEIMAHVKVPPNCHHFPNHRMPMLKSNTTMALGGETFKVDALVGEGAFAKVFRCLAIEDGQLWVIKAQKPACPWEFYVCEELRKRLPSSISGSGVMSVRDAFIFDDGSLLINDYHAMGTLLDVNNKFQKNGQEFGEYLTAFLTIQIMKILEATHTGEFIHGDVKPDNFLVTEGIPVTTDAAQLMDASVNTVKLIDWGRAIDMRHLKGQTFTGKVGTSGFECCEMLDGRPWTYQTDLFGLIGTVHVMIFGKYMSVYKESGRYKITSTIKRRWNRGMWKDLFESLLNVASCDRIPRLTEMRERLEQFLLEAIADVGKDEWLFSARCFNDTIARQS